MFVVHKLHREHLIIGPSEGFLTARSISCNFNLSMSSRSFFEGLGTYSLLDVLSYVESQLTVLHNGVLVIPPPYAFFLDFALCNKFRTLTFMQFDSLQIFIGLLKNIYVFGIFQEHSSVFRNIMSCLSRPLFAKLATLEISN